MTEPTKDIRGVGLDPNDCPYPRGKCKCPTCAVCGYRKHEGAHLILSGAAPGTRPFSCEYKEKRK